MSAISGSRRARRRRGFLLLAGTAVAALVLSACGGSAMDPEDVALANDSVHGITSGGPGAGSDGDGTLSPGGGGDGSDAPVAPDDGSDGPGGDPGTDDGTGGGSGGGPSNGGGGGGGKPAPPTGAGVKAGSCNGFKNTTGITDSTITLANIADITGPVPGFFTPAQQAAKAYVLYFNARSTICGRKLQLLPLDSQTNAGADNTAWQKACEEAFAGVGSMSAFDSGGAATTQKCGIPDLRAVQTNSARTACTVCYSAQGAGPGEFMTVIPKYFMKKDRAGTQKAAMLYVNEAASVQNALGQVRAQERVGWKFEVVSSFDIAEFNYTPYVQKLKDKGVRIVEFFGSSDMALRMAQTFRSQNYKPDFYINNAASYDKVFASGGAAAEDTIIPIDFVPLEEVGRNAEMQLYNTWLQQVSPGAKMSYFGLYSWSATRLAVQKMVELGGKLTRPALLAKIRAVRGWTANGLHAAQDVGRKGSSKCWRMIQLKGGVWKPYASTGFMCGGVVSTK